MVLKIRDGEKADKWWYFNLSEGFSIEAIRYKEAYKECSLLRDDKTDEVTTVADFIQYPRADDELIKICYRRPPDGGIWRIMFSRDAYILNDEGKTIERL